jgi:hypothetical protein
MSNPQVLFVPPQYAELLQVSFREMQKARLLYEGVANLIVNEMLAGTELPVSTKVVLDPERLCLTLETKED